MDFIHLKLFLIFTKQSAENKTSVNNSNAYCGDVTKKIQTYQNYFFQNSEKGQKRWSRKINVPKMSFYFFKKLKFEIVDKVLIFVSTLKLKHKT